MVSTGAFALAIFAVIYIIFEGLYFFSNETKLLHFGKALLLGVPFLVYVAFYFSLFWKDDVCVAQGEISTLFALGFAFSGGAVAAFLLGFLLTSIHSLFYASVCIAALSFKTTDDLCGIKPEFQIFSTMCCALSVVFFIWFTLVEFR